MLIYMIAIICTVVYTIIKFNSIVLTVSVATINDHGKGEQDPIMVNFRHAMIMNI